MDENIISYLQLERGLEKEGGICFSDRWHEVTGEQFYAAAASFAAGLLEQGIWNQPIAVKAEHRLETLALYLGALLSGNYYVPAADDMSPEQLSLVMREVKAERIYTKEEISFAAALPEETVLEKLRQARKKLPAEAVLYVIFTSGSTGKPKGIVKSHKSMIAFLESYCEAFSFSGQDVIANQTPFCFDASAKDFYLAFKYRMNLHIVDGEMFFRPLEIVKLLKERKVTVIQWVPSALSMLAQLKAFEQEVPSTLRRVFFVGETFPVRQLNYWMERLPDAEFVNLYGASEMAGVCSFFAVPDSWQEEGIPVGKALPGQKLYLIADGREIQTAGQIGEICVQSDTLAQGYLEAADDAKGKFTSALTEAIQGQRYYRTGDLARYDTEGNLCFVSREDFQIKHMGHRIELGEIENIAENMDGVDRAGAIYKKGKIQLYYQGSAERSSLQQYLKKKLQSYKLPNKIYCQEVLPLNKNGKVDRMALQNI